MDEETRNKISNLIDSDRVVLFMKGDRKFPQCGFSATTVQILDSLVDTYTTVNVLADPNIRDGIKEFSSWPTIPQLYIEKEFVGGSDIVREMYENGDLMTKLNVTLDSVEPPDLTVTPAAATALNEAVASGDDGDVVHFSVSTRFAHNMEMGPRKATDIEVESNGIKIYVDLSSAARANGVVIDFATNDERSGFKIENPNAPVQVKHVTSKELKAMLDEGEVKEFFDVRTEKEREVATLGARLLDDETMAYIATVDKDTPLAFHCHHGGRSQSAAEHFRDAGFKKVYNLVGGIDAWSQSVDSSIPRY